MSKGLTTRFIELYKDKTVLPIYRFTTDATIRLRDRESTVSGVTPADGIFLEDVDVGLDDFILLEDDIAQSLILLLEQ